VVWLFPIWYRFRFGKNPFWAIYIRFYWTCLVAGWWSFNLGISSFMLEALISGRLNAKLMLINHLEREFQFGT